MLRSRLARLEAAQPRPLTEAELAKKGTGDALFIWFHYGRKFPKYKLDPSLPPKQAEWEAFKLFLADYDPKDINRWKGQAPHA